MAKNLIDSETIKVQIDNENILLNMVYPIGSIYMSVNNTDPGTFFGGTWEQWGAGKVPVGIDTSDTDFDTSEKTGGEKTHKLITSEMPKHGGHVTTISTTNTVAGAGIVMTANPVELGGNQPHNNLQPYITCYMWKRVS